MYKKDYEEFCDDFEYFSSLIISVSKKYKLSIEKISPSLKFGTDLKDSSSFFSEKDDLLSDESDIREKDYEKIHTVDDFIRYSWKGFKEIV